MEINKLSQWKNHRLHTRERPGNNTKDQHWMKSETVGRPHPLTLPRDDDVVLWPSKYHTKWTVYGHSSQTHSHPFCKLWRRYSTFWLIVSSRHCHIICVTMSTVTWRCYWHKLSPSYPCRWSQHPRMSRWSPRPLHCGTNHSFKSTADEQLLT